jgi:AbiU2
LHICQLTDPPNMGRKTNLTILALPSLIENEAARSAAKTKVAEASASSKFCRDWRNRHIAHLDRKLALEENVEPLAPASRDHVAKSLKAVADAMNEIEGRFCACTTFYNGFSPTHGAVRLLYLIDDGLKAELEREARWSRGEWTPEDMRSQI